MKERTKTKLSYLFASMAAYPDLSLRYISAIQENAQYQKPNRDFQCVIEIIRLCLEECEGITQDVLRILAENMRRSINPLEKTAGLMLAQALGLVTQEPATPCVTMWDRLME